MKGTATSHGSDINAKSPATSRHGSDVAAGSDAISWHGSDVNAGSDAISWHGSDVNAGSDAIVVGGAFVVTNPARSSAGRMRMVLRGLRAVQSVTVVELAEDV